MSNGPYAPAVNARMNARAMSEAYETATPTALSEAGNDLFPRAGLIPIPSTRRPPRRVPASMNEAGVIAPRIEALSEGSTVRIRAAPYPFGGR